jgi:two-component system response regulator YesN
LQELLEQMPASELINLSLPELARKAQCTPRHLGRLFREELGMSFREKQSQIRLERACELLATTESKMVDVALESGYQSLSLFNLIFKRSYGVSPGKWRSSNQVTAA